MKLGSGLALPPAQGTSAACDGAARGPERVGGPAADAAESQEGGERAKDATWEQRNGRIRGILGL